MTYNQQWHIQRADALDDANYTCKSCGTRSAHLHVCDLNTNHLTVLCTTCRDRSNTTTDLTLYDQRNDDYNFYKNYLLTEAWHHRRQAALLAADHRCQVCYSDDQLHVHHRTYDNLGNEPPSDLTVLCQNCHKLFHRTNPAWNKPTQLQLRTHINRVLDTANLALATQQHAKQHQNLPYPSLQWKENKQQRALATALIRTQSCVSHQHHWLPYNKAIHDLDNIANLNCLGAANLPLASAQLALLIKRQRKETFHYHHQSLKGNP